MAEEKKKRWRPSLTAYRELEETIHRQCVELDAWREKYRELAKSADVVAYQKVVGERDQQIHYNSLKDKELENMRLSNDSLRKEIVELKDEVYSLEHRGFWSRLFNL